MLQTRSTLFVASTVYPLPTQSAWSGGSSENWFPPLATLVAVVEALEVGPSSGFEVATAWTQRR